MPKNIETYTLGLLIDNDYYNDIILESKKIQDNLYVINSKLEWFVSGKVSSINGNEKENVMFAMAPASSCLPANIHLMTTERDSSLFEPNIKELWNLETIEIKSKDNQERCDLVMQMLKNTITTNIVDTKLVGHGEPRTITYLKTKNFHLVNLKHK